MPDLRGLFLRGYGSQTHFQNNGSTVGVTSTTHTSGALGLVQGDATRELRGVTNGRTEYQRDDGMFYNINSKRWSLIGSANNNCGDIGVSSGRSMPTANEIRPVNMAVRYLIRARP